LVFELEALTHGEGWSLDFNSLFIFTRRAGRVAAVRNVSLSSASLGPPSTTTATISGLIETETRRIASAVQHFMPRRSDPLPGVEQVGVPVRSSVRSVPASLFLGPAPMAIWAPNSGRVGSMGTHPYQDHPNGVLNLNNLLHRIAKHGATRWVDRASGPQNEITWTSRLYSKHLVETIDILLTDSQVDDVEYGERSGRTKQIARDLAADDAYLILSRNYGLNPGDDGRRSTRSADTREVLPESSAVRSDGIVFARYAAAGG